MAEFVLREHFGLAVHAALLFAVGLLASALVVNYRLKVVAWLPLAVFRAVLWLLGPQPSVVRMAAVIFSFNALAIFADMASGFHPLLPKLLALWTGMNVGIVVPMAGRVESLSPSSAQPGRWVPSHGLSVACAILVLAVELPCLWFAIAMGISMGHQVQAGAVSYVGAITPRACAYLTVIVPLLLPSATAEAIAVRGFAARAR